MIQYILQGAPYEEIFAKGMRIVKRRQIWGMVGLPDDCRWRARSQTRGLQHDVCSKKSRSCTCEACTPGHKVCSHVAAVFISGASLNRSLSVGIEVPDLPGEGVGFVAWLTVAVWSMGH